MTLVQQITTYFAANLVSALCGLANVMVFTRLLGPADYGIYVVGSSLAAVLGAMLFTGLKQALLREEAKGDGTDVRATVLLGFALSSITIPLMVFAARPYFGAAGTSLCATIALCFAAGFFELGQEIARARMRPLLFLRATSLRATLVTVAGMSAILLGGGGVALLYSSAGAYLGSAGLAFSAIWRGTRVRLRDSQLIPLLIWSLPLTISMSVLAISATLDRFIVAHLLGAAAAGQYGAAVDLVRQAMIIPAVSVSSAFGPMAMRLLTQQGSAAVREHLGEGIELLMAITVPGCVGFALVAPEIAGLVLGADFREAAERLIPLISIAVIFQILVNQYLHLSFLLANRNGFYFVSTAILLLFNVAATSGLVWEFGLEGAAWSRIATELFGFVVALMLARWAFPMPLPVGRLARVALAATLMALAVWALSHWASRFDKAAIMLLVPAGMIVYGGAVLLLDVAQFRRRTIALLQRRTVEL